MRLSNLLLAAADCKSDALLETARALYEPHESAMARAVRVMSAVRAGLSCERASMLLVDRVNSELLLVCTDADAAGMRMPIDTGVAGVVVASGRAVCITDAYSDPRFDARVDRDTGFVSRDLLAVPVLTSAGGSEYVGCVVEAMNQRENGFSASHEKLLSTIALQISDRLLPDLIEHMVAMPSSDDTGMAATELSMIREVLNAEYDGGDASLDAASRTSRVTRVTRVTRATRITHASRTTRADLAQTLAIEVGLPVAASAVDVQSLDEGELPTSGNAGVKNQAVSEAETEPIGHRLGQQRAISDTGYVAVEPLDETSLFSLPCGLQEDEALSFNIDLLPFSMTELMQLAAFVFAHSGVLEAFHVPSDSLASFLAECCSHYRANPYHNFHHGVHVLHGVYLHARAGQGLYAAPLTPLELFALLTAAIGHDLEHPGVTNAFLIKTGAPLAMLYNDRSVLESHHCATTFRLLALPHCSGMLSGLSEEERDEMRALMIETILATDMAHHHALIQELAQHAAGGSGPSGVMPPVDVLRAVCHLADLSNPVLKFELAEAWSVRVGQEAVAQAIEETRLGLPLPKGSKVTPYSRSELAARMLVFIDDWVRPLYKVAAMLFPGAESRLVEIERNREECIKILSKGKWTILPKPRWAR